MLSKWTGFLKTADLFPTPVSLTFKGETTFKTRVGGIFSIVLVILFIVGFILELIDVAKRERMETTRNEIFFDLLTTNNTYNLYEGGFDIAFATSNFWNLTIEQEKKFIQWDIAEVRYSRDYDNNVINEFRTSIDVVECNSSHFRLPDGTENFFKQNKGYRCLKKRDNLLKGNWFNLEYYTLEIKANYCIGTVKNCTSSNSADCTCHSLSKIEGNVTGSILSFVHSHSFLDFDDIETPIKRKFEDRRFRLTYGELIDYGLHVVKSEYTLYDSPIWSSQVTKQGEFYSLDQISQTSDPRLHITPIFIELKMSSKVNNLERRVYSIYDALGNLGGFIGIFQIIFAFMAGYFGSKIYYHKLMNHIMEVSNSTEAKKPKFGSQRELQPDKVGDCSPSPISTNDHANISIPDNPYLPEQDKASPKQEVEKSPYDKERYSSKFLCADILFLPLLSRIFSCCVKWQRRRKLNIYMSEKEAVNKKLDVERILKSIEKTQKEIKRPKIFAQEGIYKNPMPQEESKVRQNSSRIIELSERSYEIASGIPPPLTSRMPYRLDFSKIQNRPSNSYVLPQNDPSFE
ncbi:unnamed protein product [Moneuplotes crassus]|uniref:Uncharacterized protein n=1 Tax=Euplotes crassus TaxID=5936 RepID=A0AAD2DAD9_EUPCR|nr:unnamed protein product [Moneuplotes crassus]